jgi:hypothetical protein
MVGVFNPAEALAEVATAAFPFSLIAFGPAVLVEEAELPNCPVSHTFAADDSWSFMLCGSVPA